MRHQSLAGEFFALNHEQMRLVHFMLCKHALDQWSLYANAQGPIEYVETVAGTRQVVDQRLPFDAYGSARQGLNSGDIANRYREPIVAMQDDDLVFPENIVFAYYAIYNLFKKYGQDEAVDDWVIVNQALAMEDDPDVWTRLLQRAIQVAKE